ncbi:MAG: C-GCAxxG-C-C family (seleno)protein, partial [Eggerthella lenta]
YRIVRKLVNDFREQNGSTLCPELKGIKTKQPLRSCDGCIVDALQLAADALAGLPADKPLDA